MHIREIWIRFYKSFNYDYELKATPGARRQGWQETSAGWMPHVRVPIERDITAVVGANETGKSHLLDAIRIALTGQGLLQRDFCRYSPLFSVEQDSRLFPEVGVTIVPEGDEPEFLAEREIPTRMNGELLLLRPEPGRMDVVSTDNERVHLDDAQVAHLESLLPYPYLVKTEVALPDFVSISELVRDTSALAGRKRRNQLFALLAGLSNEKEATANASGLLDILNSSDSSDGESQALGKILLTKIARIDEGSFQELRSAIADEREGLVNGLIQEMNNSIARHLNITRWWSQDPEFQLRISPREHELVFTIRDRTGTDYSFTERSRGLRYFLSYYVQLLAHDRPVDRPEVLLIDEPDAYLSASGQQDLLRVLENYARPPQSPRLDQVIYVTHSPFLINRNAGHRVRVVDKGSRDEGSRLVKDATQNHYEPLRSSLGAFVAETAFIGGDNLFVEGIADQVLIAGMNARLLRAGAAPSNCLDLNQVTIVPCGSNVPYMLYLARGRDPVKPACAVLLDSDDSGNRARKQIRRGGAHGKPTVADDLVIMVAEWAERADLQVSEGVVVREPEDLIPVEVAVRAARRYAERLLGLDEVDAKRLDQAGVRSRLAAVGGSLWDALAGAFEDTFETGLNKAGLAKELLGYLEDEATSSQSRPPGVPALDRNFASLLDHLADILRTARERETNDRRDRRLERIIDAFAADFPTGSTKDRAALTLNRIDRAVDESTAGDIIRAGTARLRRDFQLTVDPLESVTDYPTFLEGLNNLRHLERLSHQGLLDQ